MTAAWVSFIARPASKAWIPAFLLPILLLIACGGTTSPGEGGADAATAIDAGSFDGGVSDAGVVDPPSCEIAHGGCGADEVCSVESERVKCERCLSGFAVENNTCVNVNECLATPAICGDHSICTDTPGSFDCSCVDGFERKDGVCQDIDECVLKTAQCDTVGICSNTVGGYTCSCPDDTAGNGFSCAPKGLVQSIYAEGDVGFLPPPVPVQPSERGMRFRMTTSGKVIGLRYYRQTSAWKNDFQGHLWNADTQALLGAVTFTGAEDGWQTAYFDQAVEVTANAEYIASYGSPTETYMSPGQDGWWNDLYGNSFIIPAHSSAKPNGITGTPGAFPDQGSPNGVSYPVDFLFVAPADCAVDNGGCSSVAACAPTSSSVRCTCPTGFVEQMGSACVDINECLDPSVQCGAHATCQNLSGSYDCPCDRGYELDGTDCVDTDECQTTPGLCAGVAQCRNNPGSYACLCPANEVYEAGCVAPSRVFTGLVANNVQSQGVASSASFGARFSVSSAGRVTGLRYYRVSNAASTSIVGKLWDAATGAELASAAFTGTTDGWQTAALTPPVSLVPGTMYIVSYDAPQGSYVANILPNFGSGDLVSGPITFPESRFDQGNGVVSSNGIFDINARGVNYGADVVFVLDDLCGFQNGGCPSQATCAQTGDAVQCTCPTGYTYSGGACVDVNECTALTATCPAGTTCRNVEGAYACDCPTGFVLNGGVCVEAAPVRKFSVLESVAPANDSDSTVTPLELGARFRVDSAGSVTALRYYRSPAATMNDYVGRLWDGVSHQLLATVAFTGTTAGWNEAALSTPVTLTPQRTYIVSYGSSDHVFARTTGQFQSNGFTQGPLTILGDGEDGPNGVFGDVGLFPSNSYASSNYFADVVFLPDAACPASLANCSAHASCYAPSPGQYQCSCDRGYLGDGTNCARPVIEYSAIPDDALYVGSQNQFFIEVGMKFRMTSAGRALGVRFYCADLSSDWTGRLWDATTQQLLGTVTFPGNYYGWQKGYFTTAISLQPNHTYIASYSSVNSSARWRSTSYYAQAVVNGPLRALADGEDGGNGVYSNSCGTFPDQSYAASNYFADVIVAEDLP